MFKRCIAVVLLLALWQVAAALAGSNFFPPPSQILAKAWNLWLSGPKGDLTLTENVTRDVVPSIGRMLAGWAIAVIVGASLGLVIGRFALASDLLLPSIEFLRSLPSPALIPVFLVLLGTETPMRVTLIAFGSVWPVLLNTIDGARTVDPVQLDMARVMRLPAAARLWRIIIPSALPKVFAGMRVALAISVVLMVVSELVASTDGIGHFVVTTQQLFDLRGMWAGIVLIALIGLVLDVAFSASERRILQWHRGARGR